MPAGKTVEDYPFLDVDGHPRWPVGWPLDTTRTVKLPLDGAPELKPLVVEACGPAAWRRMAATFQGGAPSRLQDDLAPLAAAVAPYFPGI